jgi:hypothetical protein
MEPSGRRQVRERSTAAVWFEIILLERAGRMFVHRKL